MIVAMSDSTQKELMELVLVIRSGKEEISDEVVWDLFLNFGVDNEDEICAVVQELKLHRPELYKKLEGRLEKSGS